VTDNPPAINPNLVSRVVGILTKPALEWEVIKGETTDIRSLFTGYALPLSLIAPICVLISTVLFVGMAGPAGVGGVLVGAIIIALLSWVLNLVSVFVLGLVIDGLASSFGAQPARVQAMKVAVYSMTASWVAGLLTLIPVLGGLLALLAGLYGIYLLYLGLKQVMGSPQDKAIIYTLVVVVIMAVIMTVVGMIVGMIGAMVLVTGAVAAGAAAGAYGA
jgi:hypothetical protein